MTVADLTNLITQAAGKYGLPVWLVSAIVATESGGDPWAVRFEPRFRSAYVPQQCQTFGVCSHETERTLRACSFGLMQLMGQVAREYGYRAPFLTALCAPATGLEYGCRHLARQRDRFFADHGWPGVAAAYNAGSPRKADDGQFVNQEYVNKIMQHQPQGEITADG